MPSSVTRLKPMVRIAGGASGLTTCASWNAHGAFFKPVRYMTLAPRNQQLIPH